MKNKSMMVIIGIILALIIILCSDTVFANAIIIGGNTTSNTTTGNVTENTTANVQNTVANTTTNISVPSTTTNRVNTTQTLPQTGNTIYLSIIGIISIFTRFVNLFAFFDKSALLGKNKRRIYRFGDPFGHIANKTEICAQKIGERVAVTGRYYTENAYIAIGVCRFVERGFRTNALFYYDFAHVLFFSDACVHGNYHAALMDGMR